MNVIPMMGNNPASRRKKNSVERQGRGIKINGTENHLPGGASPLTDTDWTRFRNTQLHPAEPYPPNSHATVRRQHNKGL